MKKSTLFLILAIVLCVAIIAGLFTVVRMRSAQDAEYAAEQASSMPERDFEADKNESDETEATDTDAEDGDDTETAEDAEAAEDGEETEAAEGEEGAADGESAADAEAAEGDEDAADTEDAEPAEDAEAAEGEEAAEDTEDTEPAEDGETAEDADAAAVVIEPAEEVAVEDSAVFYQKLADGEPVNILVVGDSISAGMGASSEDAAWTEVLAEELQKAYGSEVSMTNLSVAGSSSYAGYMSVTTLDSDEDFDLVIVCFGQNDSEDDLGLYYEVLLRSICSRWPDCAIISVLESSQREFTAKMQTIMELADRYSVMIVDTITPFADNYDNLTNEDGIHPNDDGQGVYAQAMLDAIMLRHEPTASDAEPANEDVEKYDDARWYPASKFAHTGANTYEAIIEDAGALGIAYGYADGNYTDPVVYLDDEAVSFTPDIVADRELVLVSDDAVSDFTVRIEFADEAQAELFEGILFSD